MSPETVVRTDVLVVGGGGAGLAAALEARATGAEVLLIEKNRALGGSTAWSVGSITSTGTPHQRAEGIEDTPAQHHADMPLFAGDLQERDNDALRRVLCEHVPDTFRWLIGHGVRFYGPMPEPPHTRPRMHNVLPNSRAFIDRLGRAAGRAGVAFRTGVRARRLIVQGDRVGGLEAETGRGMVRIEAGRGVVLAAGDFTSGADFKRRYMSDAAARIDGVNRSATGDGQAMALEVGARILNGDLALGPEIRFVPPARETMVHRLPPWPALGSFMAWSLGHLPPTLLRPFVMSFVTTALAPSPALFEAGAVLINRNGERFTEELDDPAYALADQPDGEGFILLDHRLAWQFSAWPHFVSTAPGVAYAYVPDYRRNRKDVFLEAPTLGALAEAMGIDGERLAGTVREHGQDLRASVRPRSNRPRYPALDDGPYVALGPVRSVFVHSEGGLAVDLEHRVLGPNDRPILGLWAAGSTGQGGLLLKGHGHHLAWAFTSGRRAGRFAAASPDARP